MAQPRRVLVLRAQPQSLDQHQLHLRRRTRNPDRLRGLPLEREPRALRLHQTRRRDPRQSRPRTSHSRPDRQIRDTPLGCGGGKELRKRPSGLRPPRFRSALSVRGAGLVGGGRAIPPPAVLSPPSPPPPPRLQQQPPWSGRRGSNSRPLPWQGGGLPVRCASRTELTAPEIPGCTAPVGAFTPY